MRVHDVVADLKVNIHWRFEFEAGNDARLQPPLLALELVSPFVETLTNRQLCKYGRRVTS